MKKHKVLVANRSEIACRVFQACREMGIPTVAICAPGDEQARHLTYADEVIPVTRYLDIESVVGAAKKSGATLVHPGYGFLSERPEFADACEKAGITFVGPRAETMRALGEKIAAKELDEKAKVPTLPWAKVKQGEDLATAASRVGFPLLLKASAGGGGKGMRRVNQASELKEAAESASAEAVAAFGDGTLFLERLVENPRHIEVQIFGDGKGGGGEGEGGGGEGGRRGGALRRGAGGKGGGGGALGGGGDGEGGGGDGGGANPANPGYGGRGEYTKGSGIMGESRTGGGDSVRRGAGVSGGGGGGAGGGLGVPNTGVGGRGGNGGGGGGGNGGGHGGGKGRASCGMGVNGGGGGGKGIDCSPGAGGKGGKGKDSAGIGT